MKTDRRYVYGFTIILIFWQLLLSFQGLDLADTGFHLTAFRFILEDPYSVQYSMVFWLSDILGAAWMNIFPAGGLFWCRLGTVVFFTLTFLIYHRIIKQETGFRGAVLGLFIIAVFIIKGGFECLNYDVLTMFGYSLVILSFYFGLTQRRSILLFAGGMAIGISMFLRLTNFAGLFLLLVIPCYLSIQKAGMAKNFRQTLFALSGFITGTALILGLMVALGHRDLFFNNLNFIFNVASDHEASHGIVPLIIMYVKGFINALIVLLLFLVAIWIYGKITTRSGINSRPLVRLVLPLVLAFCAFILMLVFGNAFWSKIRYLLIGLVLLSGIQYVTDRSRTAGFRMLAFAGLILFFITPFGSDSWLGKSVFGMWILVPLLLAGEDLRTLFKPVRIELSEQDRRMIFRTLRGMIIVTALVHAWQNTYFDAGSRWLKNVPVAHEKLVCIYTSEERAKAINELVREAFPMIDETYLLSFIEIPMINYLADKPPYISTSWPKLYYNADTFSDKLAEAKSLRDSLPAVIRQKQNTGLAEWPADAAADRYLDYPDDLSKWPEHGRILNDFMHRNGYEVAWENNMFQLLVPPA